MANSRYEYVRSFEQPDVLLANTWIVVRIDGRGFSKLTTKYKFAKPNDKRALDLMNAAAEAVMKELPDLVLAYGNSDEFSFVFHKDCVLFERRASKLTTTIVSTFTSYYTFLWQTYFPVLPLTPPLPSFDGRAVCYPSDQNLRDYMSWRQVDCHINNLYNTSFWALVQQGGMDHRAAERELSGTISSDKNEILFSRFGINYNNEPEIFKKGSILYRDFFPVSTQSSPTPPQAAQSPPPLSHPQPRKLTARPMSQPIERTVPDLLRDSPSSAASTPRGPTFLSTSTTPSPPPSPREMSMAALPNPLQAHPFHAGFQSFPQSFMPISQLANGSSITSHNKQPLPVLTPLPLPPPTLKPSTKPPHSLNPPNPTAHINTSPVASPNIGFFIPDRVTSNPSRQTSHSASASLPVSIPSSNSTVRPATASASDSNRLLKHRSPSLSILEGAPPQIPLRISSIPLNNKPRKLSLPNQNSYSMLKQEEKENLYFNSGGGGGSNSNTGGLRISPPLMTMKELPSPPTDVDEAVREKVMGVSSAEKWNHRSSSTPSPRQTKDKDKDPSPHSIWKAGSDASPLPPHTQTPPTFHKPTGRARSHSRLHSAPTSSYFPPPPSHHPSHQMQNQAFSSSASTAVYQPSSTPSWPPNFTSSPNTTPNANPNPPTSPYPNPLTMSKSPTNTSSKTPSLTPSSIILPAHANPLSTSTPTPVVKPSRKATLKAHKIREQGGWAAGTGSAMDGGEGNPKAMSKTAREKDRKKRMKARVVVEHVDLIRDEFWERRPWILSGRAG
ncbi:Thg1-domain-containing protein [Melanomma pulvis-pyrius CBS 109.77]|uniref:tRNA(His) guanylyltransferase n=1 Tax=Melanomma pulvis-pyrius CBS 109.77 TaxID=1314802 RepID=A0A6A6XJ77_9PLEO|nr:Thg1-domain-containing protein [Melanomma pulvis-pyrius CBS 109.77]